MKEIELKNAGNYDREFLRDHNSLKIKYEKIINELGIYNLSKEELLIYKIASTFGECEMDIPDLFVEEVKKYIGYWKRTTKLRDSIAKARLNGYDKIISYYLSKHHLPKQYFYLALQESAFDEKAVGPRTKYGYAKGIWQFIPLTAEAYGLKLGILKELSEYDPRDERFDIEKSSDAAARYISNIYNTDAQASGLLVMACYNWGDTRVVNMIRKLPKNSKQRNFWTLLTKYREKIPQQTYDYVFYIISAAVIGSDPKFFGFDFEIDL